MEDSRLNFRLARSSPSLDPRVEARLDQILRLPCFEDRPPCRKKLQGKRAHRYRAPGPPPAPLTPTRALAASSGSDSQRAIRCDLNKLASSNYARICRRIRIAADADNIAFALRTALDKAYLEPEHSRLYVRLLSDLLDSLAAEARAAALGVLRDDLPTQASVIRREALRPHTSPTKDYDEFCNACREKRRIVGRSATFAILLDIPTLSSALDATPLDVYRSHERVMMDIVCDAASDAGTPGLDAAGAVEIMLDSINGVCRLHHHLKDEFRARVRAIDFQTLPSPMCRFKVLDILGR